MRSDFSGSYGSVDQMAGSRRSTHVFSNHAATVFSPRLVCGGRQDLLTLSLTPSDLLSLSLSLFLSLSLCFCLSVSLFLSLSLSLSLSVCLCLYLVVCLSVCMSLPCPRVFVCGLFCLLLFWGKGGGGAENGG